MSNNSTQDYELIKSYIKGNEKSFSILIDKYQMPVYHFIITKIKDEDTANDLFQDTFIKAIIALKTDKYNDTGKFLSWLLRIANNVMMDYFRGKDKTPICSIDTYIKYNGYSESNKIEEIFILEENFKTVTKLMEELVPEQKEILILRFEKEKSFKEIALMTNVSINTALGRFRYAIDNLRKIIRSRNIQLLN